MAHTLPRDNWATPCCSRPQNISIPRMSCVAFVKAQTVFLLLLLLLLRSCSSNLDKLLDCLGPQVRSLARNTNKSTTSREQHYADLLEKTSKFRGLQPHSHAGYSGPWIENVFISRFLQAPLSSFHGIMPLFIQWTDIMVLAMLGTPQLLLNLTEALPSLLHKDEIYVAVSQHDYGLGRNITHLFPNILVLSAGGYGHVPLPLVKGELAYVEPPLSVSNFTFDFSFFGKNTHHKRGAILTELQQALDDEDANYKFAFHDRNWMHKMAQSKFNFAPRGLGRASFRLAEIVQLGRIPVNLVSDDTPWVPYDTSNISITSIGYSAKQGSFASLVRRLMNATEEEVQSKLHRVKLARRAYTYDGIMDEVKLFFSDLLLRPAWAERGKPAL